MVDGVVGDAAALVFGALQGGAPPDGARTGSQFGNLQTLKPARLLQAGLGAQASETVE